MNIVSECKMMRTVVSFALLAILGQMAASQSYQDLVLGLKGAYCLMPTRLVSGPGTFMAAISYDGKFVLSACQETDQVVLQKVLLGHDSSPLSSPSQRLILWTERTGKSRDLQIIIRNDQLVNRIEWIPNSHLALIQMSCRDQTIHSNILLLLNADSGKVKELAREEEWRFFSVALSSTEPIAFLSVYQVTPSSDQIHTFELFSIGLSGELVPVKLPIRLRSASVHNDPDSGKFLLTVRDEDDNRSRYEYDAVLGKFVPAVSKEEVRSEIESDYSLVMKPLRVDSSRREKQSYSCWIVTKNPSAKSEALVSPDVYEVIQSANFKTVLYICEEGAFVRNIQPLPKERFDILNAAHLKTAAIRDAKDAALALIMMAADQDDHFPTKAEYDSMDAKYFPDATVKDRFVYTYSGGSINSIDSPSTTVIG